jgi:hypothetical protein
VTGELISGLAEVLGVVFVAFVKDVGADVISPDSAGAVDDLNLYVYVGNNPLKYTDPTGYVKVIPVDILFKFAVKTNSPLEKYIVFLKIS